MKDQLCLLAWIALEPSHLQSIDHQLALHIWPHRPAHHFTAEQVDYDRQKQPAFCGRDIRHITHPRLVGRGHDELAIQHIRRHRQVVPAVGGGNPESPLATSLNAVLLHQPLHPQLANPNALRPQLPPDARPSIGSAILRINGADMHQQRLVTQVATPQNVSAANQVFMVARYAHAQHPALHADWPHPPVTLNKGVLHFWPFAKYAVAFPRMSRSILTRANSARKRLISICSALTALPLLAPLSRPSRCALTQLNSVCSTTPRLRAAAAMLWPDSTSRTASCLNSSVYCARVDLVIFVSLVDSQSFS